MPTNIPVIKQVDLPLGIRINNPGNIRDEGISWQGLVGSEEGFCQFDSPVSGLRAMMLNLRNMQILHGCQSITDIITRYAPPSENDTEAYIDAVAETTGWDDDEFINLKSLPLVTLAKAMVRVEQGPSLSIAGFIPPSWYSDDVYMAAYKALP
jgi:hypothetical protein